MGDGSENDGGRGDDGGRGGDAGDRDKETPLIVGVDDLLRVEMFRLVEPLADGFVLGLFGHPISAKPQMQ